jgi:hypothetical protein
MRYHAIPIALAFLGTSFAAHAQKVGEYDGTTADGSSVEIKVAKDPNNSKLEVTVVGFGLSLDCAKSGETLNDIGIGLGDGYDIVNGKFTYASANFFDVDLVTAMTFHGKNTVKGTVGGGLSAYNPAYGHDTLIKDVQNCSSPKQSFIATFAGPATIDIPAGMVKVGNQPATIHK